MKVYTFMILTSDGQYNVLYICAYVRVYEAGFIIIKLVASNIHIHTNVENDLNIFLAGSIFRECQIISRVSKTAQRVKLDKHAIYNNYLIDGFL